jgi:hypothetical protein
LRQRLRDSGRFSLVDITPIASEALASNLQACGGRDIQLARRIGAITGTVHLTILPHRGAAGSAPLGIAAACTTSSRIETDSRGE